MSNVNSWKEAVRLRLWLQRAFAEQPDECEREFRDHLDRLTGDPGTPANVSKKLRLNARFDRTSIVPPRLPVSDLIRLDALTILASQDSEALELLKQGLHRLTQEEGPATAQEPIEDRQHRPLYRKILSVYASMRPQQKALWRDQVSSESADKDPVDGIRYLAINLLEDDEELIRNFKKWLRTRRQQEGYHRTPFDEQDFDLWHQYKLLPVFDLTLWGEITGRKFTNEFIGDTLWPRLDLDLAERVRKTVRPKVEEIISPKTLWRLARTE